MADVLNIDPEHLRGRHLRRAVEVLVGGGVLIYPTDTIYGLGCDITQKTAVERIRRIKGRDARKPMSFVCADLNDIARYARVSNYAYRILRRLLPGPYTFVLPATKETPRLLRSRQKTVGIRIPDHPVTAALVRELGPADPEHQRQPLGAGRDHGSLAARGRAGPRRGPDPRVRPTAGAALQRRLPRGRRGRRPAPGSPGT